jgi:hypothetical protein
MEHLPTLLEMGIPLPEATDLLQKTSSVEEAIDVYLNKPKFTFGSSQPYTQENIVVQSLPTSRDPIWQIEEFKPKSKKQKIGLVGIKDVHISPLLHVVARWSEAVQILFNDAFTMDPVVHSLEPKDVPFSQCTDSLM